MNWPYLKLFWLSKDDSTGQHERKRRKDRQKKRWEDNNIKEWTGIDFDNSNRTAEDRIRWKLIVVKTSVVSQRPRINLHAEKRNRL